MKRFFKSAPVSIFLLLIAFGAGIYFTSNVVAQEATESSSENALVQKIDDLVDALMTLTSQNEATVAEGSSGGISIQGAASGISNPRCLDNYESWPNSTTRSSNASWDISLIDMKSVANPITNFVDINGDGLSDYVYHEAGSITSYSDNNGTVIANLEKSCLLMNNGAGWDIEFRCVNRLNSLGGGSYEIRYYGDCAQL